MEIFWWYSNQSLANTAGQKRCFTKMDIPQDSRLSSGSLIKGKIYLDNSISDGFFETRIYWNGKSNQYNSMFPTIMYWYWLIHQSIFSGFRTQKSKILSSTWKQWERYLWLTRKLQYRIVREVLREAQSGATVSKYGGWKMCHMDHWYWQLTRTLNYFINVIFK